MPNQNREIFSTSRFITESTGRFSPFRLFMIIIASIFFAEVLAMVLVNYFERLPYYQTTLIDAAFMVVLIFPILYYFSFRPLIQYIEQLRHAEQTVQVERTRLRSILDTMPDGVYIINQQYDVEYVSPVIEREFGPVAGKKCFAYFHDENEPCRWCKNPAVFGGATARWEWTSIKTGKIYEVFDTPLANADGTLSKLKVIHDVTERKRSEETVRLLSSVVEQTADTVVVTDCEGLIQYVNPAFEQLTGYAKEEALGQTPRLLKSGMHNAQFYKQLWDTAGSGQVFHSEMTNRKKNGEMFHEAKTISPLRNANGEITHFVATGKDITERKLAEQRLREAYDSLEVRVQERTEELRIANSELEDEINVRRRAEEALQLSEQRLKRAQEIAHLGSWELDLIENRLTWSDEVYRIFGLQPQEFGATYEAFLEAVHPDDRAAVDEAYSGSIRDGRDSYEIEHRVVRRSNGEVRTVHEKCEHFRDETGSIIRSVGMVHDITERKRAEEDLRRSEALLLQTGEMAKVGGWELELQTKTLRWSLQTYRIHEVDPSVELDLDSAIQYYAPIVRPIIAAAVEHAIETGQSYNLELPLVTATGRNIWIRTKGQPEIREGKCVRLFGTFQDITERKQTQEKLQELNAELEQHVADLQTLMDVAPVGIAIGEDPEGNRITVNRLLSEWLGSPEGANVSLSAPEQERKVTYQVLRKGQPVPAEELPIQSAAIKARGVRDDEFTIIRSDGISLEMLANAEPLFDSTGCVRGAIATFYDITERKRAEQALEQNEAMLRAVLDQMPSGVAVRDARTGEIVLSNARSREIMGYLVETTERFSEYGGMHPEGSLYRGQEWPVFRSITSGEKVDAEEIEFERSPGTRSTLSVSSAPIQDSQGQIVSGVAVFHDITERKKAERELQQINRTLRAHSASNQAVLRARNEKELLAEVCTIVVEDCGHAMIWIGYAQDDPEKSVRPVASAGFDAGYLETLKISWADTERGRGPTGRAIRTGKPHGCRNMQTDPEFAPWREQALQRGYASSLAVPLISYGKPFGAMTIYSREPNAFSSDEEALLSELAGDLMHGIEMIRLREAHERATAELRLAHDELELRVQKRTEELASANRELSEEIRERLEIERQMRIQTVAMESAANGIIITDPQGTILWTNPAVTQISGYSYSELVGQNTRLFGSGKQDREFYRQMWNTILAGRVWHGETTNRRKDGRLYVEEQTITPIRDEQGQVSHFIAIKQDVTERKFIYAQLEASNRELMQISDAEHQQRLLAEGLVQASAALNMNLELDVVLDHIFDQTQRIIPYQMADIVLIEERRANIVRQWGYTDRPEARTLVGGRTLCLEDFPAWERICTTKSAVTIPDTQLEPQWSSYFGEEGIRSYLGAPLIYNGQVIGIIDLVSGQANTFHEQMAKSLRAFAAPAAVAIQNARLYENEQQNRKIAEILSAASVALAQTLDIQMVMETILDYMQFVVPCDVALVILSEGEERYRIRAVRSGGDQTILQESLQDEIIDTVSEPIVRSYFARYESTYIADARAFTELRPPLELASLNCWLGIPLESMGKILGIVVAAHATPNSFTRKQIRLAEAVVKQAVVALQNAWLFEQVRAGRERLQQLSRHLVEIQENERKYIARELHDETSQSLTSLKLGLQLIEQKAAGNEQLAEQVTNLKALADETLESLHRLAVDIRPASLDHLGLVDALTGLLEATRQRSGLTVHFKVMGVVQQASLKEELETSIYRIVQESLTNVVRHAHAAHADVILDWQSDKIVIIIEDDGVGIDMEKAQESGHLGLVGMQERAEMLGGKFLVDSTPQVGTTLVVEIPYAHSNPYSR